MKKNREVLMKEKLQSLQHHGVFLNNEKVNIQQAMEIGYYRLSQMAFYLDEEDSAEKRTVSDLVMVFRYEQALRSCLMERVTAFEIYLRTMLSEFYDEWFTPYGYLDKKNFQNHDIHNELIRKITKQVQMKSVYEVVDEQKMTARELEHIPIWTALELSTFHMLTLFVEVLPKEQGDALASYFQLTAQSFQSCLNFLLVVRNACAHQGILFGRQFSRKPEFRHEVLEGTVANAFVILDDFLAYKHSFLVTPIPEVSAFDEKLTWMKKYFGFND